MIQLSYDILEDKEHSMDILESMLDETDIELFVDGLFVILSKGMTKEDIVRRIAEEKVKFEKRCIPIEKKSGEAIQAFCRRLAVLTSTSDEKCFIFEYHGKKVKAVPGSKDYQILLQMVKIDEEYVRESGIECVEMDATPGSDYIQFGERIYEVLRTGKCVLGTYNNVTIAFTPDMARYVRYDWDRSPGYLSSDAFVFAQMFHAIQFDRYYHREKIRLYGKKPGESLEKKKD